MLELTLDYNGLARFMQMSANPPSGQADATDAPIDYDGGFSRLFNANFAPEGGWLLFTALTCAIALALLWRQSRGAPTSSGLTTVGVVWLGSAYAVLSFMGSMTHTYYVFSLAAPIALVIPLGLAMLWNQRDRPVTRLIGAVLLLGTGYTAARIFQYSDHWGLWPAVVVFSAVAAVTGWLFASTNVHKWITLTFATLLLVLAPAATDAVTLSGSHTGTNPVSGPAGNNPQTLSAHLDAARRGDPPLARHLGFGVETSPEVTALLRDSGTATWAAATYTAQNAAVYQLSSQRPVIALGGWLGNDPAPTLDQFKSLVEDRQVAYFIRQQIIVDELPLGRNAVAITDWVQSNFEGETVDGVTIYDLRN
jgi:hypothetical protein